LVLDLAAGAFGYWVWQLVVIRRILMGGLVVIGHSTLVDCEKNIFALFTLIIKLE
jgi:hypothetical protein